MTTPAYPPVQAVPAFTIPGAGQGFVSDPVLLFTAPGDIPSLVNAVFLNVLCTSVANSFLSEQYVLQFVAPGGAIQAEVWSPIFDTGEDTLTSAVLQLTWMLGGVGTDQSATVTFVVYGGGMENNGLLAATLALPEMVLQPQAQVNIVRTGLEIAGDVQVSGVVTYTPNGGLPSTTDAFGILPLVVPQSNG